MRAAVVTAVRERLENLNVFSKVCGLGYEAKEKGPLCRVWIQGGTPEGNPDNRPPRAELRIILQIETRIARDHSGDTDDGPLYDLVDAVVDGMHNYKLPGAGSEPFVVLDTPGFKGFDQETGLAVYVLQAPIRVLPQNFTLT